MKEIVRRTLIVLWLLATSGFIGVVFESGLFHSDTWIIAAALFIPVWALQFIFTGLVNPTALFSAKGGTSGQGESRDD